MHQLCVPDHYIRDIDALRAHHNTSSPIYVAIDTEGQEGYRHGVTSVGLAILSPVPFNSSPFPGTNLCLDEFVLEYDIKACSLRIDGRPRKERPEPFRYGQVQICPLEELEGCLSTFILGNVYSERKAPRESQEEAKSIPRVYLVAWGLPTELTAMTTLFPRLAEHIDGYVDLAEIAARMSGIRPESKKRRSLRDTLITLGYDTNDTYSVQNIWRPHSHDPGMDAARTLAALLGLIGLPGKELAIPEWTLEEKEARRKLSRRPPRSEYPYAVRIAMGDGSSMPQSINTPQKLDEFVERHFPQGGKPSAVAVCPPSKSKTQKTHAWVCFEGGFSAMEEFVRLLNKQSVDGLVLGTRIDGPEELGKNSNQSSADDFGRRPPKSEPSTRSSWVDELDHMSCE